jgi:hypothetical protein
MAIMSTAQKAQHSVPRRSSLSRPVAAGLAVLAVVAALALPQAAGAQPYNIYLGLSGPTHGYVRVPHSTALNPTSGFTFEAWVLIQDANGGGCSSIAGKNYVQAWWVGICGTTLRSYLKGSGSQRNGGVIPAGQWTHIAVTFDGANRRHYINGELVGTFAETGPLFTSTDELRIGSDTQWQHTPVGRIDEVRLWSVARTLSQIRDTINTPITTALSGLVSVWPFETTYAEIIHGHNGTEQGSGVSFFTFGTLPGCTSTSTTLCIGGSGGRFSLNARFRTGAPGTAEGQGQVAVGNAGSGLFWFFGSDNWEVLVKSINGCGLNSRYWVFSAATTNVFYRLEVFDRSAGRQKIYFNYPGPPAPAVTDTSAFATCP